MSLEYEPFYGEDPTLTAFAPRRRGDTRNLTLSPGAAVDLCAGVICPPGMICRDGACVDPKVNVEPLCLGVICPPGQRCNGGACVDVEPATPNEQKQIQQEEALKAAGAKKGDLWAEQQRIAAMDQALAQKAAEEEAKRNARDAAMRAAMNAPSPASSNQPRETPVAYAQATPGNIFCPEGYVSTGDLTRPCVPAGMGAGALLALGLAAKFLLF